MLRRPPPDAHACRLRGRGRALTSDSINSLTVLCDCLNSHLSVATGERPEVREGEGLVGARLISRAVAQAPSSRALASATWPSPCARRAPSVTRLPAALDPPDDRCSDSAMIASRYAATVASMRPNSIRGRGPVREGVSLDTGGPPSPARWREPAQTVLWPHRFGPPARRVPPGVQPGDGFASPVSDLAHTRWRSRSCSACASA